LTGALRSNMYVTIGHITRNCVASPASQSSGVIKKICPDNQAGRPCKYGAKCKYAIHPLDKKKRKGKKDEAKLESQDVDGISYRDHIAFIDCTDMTTSICD
jgi:hypothetical protein